MPLGTISSGCCEVTRVFWRNVYGKRGKMPSDNDRPVVLARRIETFSACHRLHNPCLSDEVNQKIYGKCNHINGHGHNYKVEVALKGPVDPVTGMVINIVDLKQIINKCVMDVLDHKNIDKDVPYFKYNPSTGENIVVFIWNQLSEELNQYNQADLLFEVKLHETEKNVFSYYGEKTSSK
ncbi:6-pyruvoyl tetrahydrobiopterin synthase isoform X1 [Octopus bimaculoides]|nr:6-pyruvoyl tetrahydrobiopterin synthase isoform X1 [Octopus bimaculoides]|eukprot:XP_014780662.1 PREDICTED: 6-pyruvoyl tetrahydrobiopterin synthase-like isoform X1 [Octopus bimaculoides]